MAGKRLTPAERVERRGLEYVKAVKALESATRRYDRAVDFIEECGGTVTGPTESPWAAQELRVRHAAEDLEILGENVEKWHKEAESGE